MLMGATETRVRRKDRGQPERRLAQRGRRTRARDRVDQAFHVRYCRKNLEVNDAANAERVGRDLDPPLDDALLPLTQLLPDPPSHLGPVRLEEVAQPLLQARVRGRLDKDALDGFAVFARRVGREDEGGRGGLCADEREDEELGEEEDGLVEGRVERDGLEKRQSQPHMNDSDRRQVNSP